MLALHTKKEAKSQGPSQMVQRNQRR